MGLGVPVCWGNPNIALHIDSTISMSKIQGQHCQHTPVEIICAGASHIVCVHTHLLLAHHLGDSDCIDADCVACSDPAHACCAESLHAHHGAHFCKKACLRNTVTWCIHMLIASGAAAATTAAAEPEFACPCLPLRAMACLCAPLQASACLCTPLPAPACLCLPLRAPACLCAPLRASACLCTPLPAPACLCLPLRAPACKDPAQHI
eukprot:353840-Chlamydomonas_euryale.AAC.4